MPIHRKTLNKCAPRQEPIHYEWCSQRDREGQELRRRQFLARQAAHYTTLLLEAENAVTVQQPVVRSPDEWKAASGFTFDDDALWAERRKQAMDAEVTASMQRVDEKAAEESKSKWTLPVAALAVARELEKLCLEEKGKEDEQKEVTQLKFTFGKSGGDETQVTD
jgi:hypothetical protein